MRRGGTPMARASADWLKLMGSRNSRSRISPGRGLGSSASVVIDDFDIFGSSLDPVKTDPPLIVDAEWMLALAVPLQRLEPVARWDFQVVQPTCGVEEAKFAQRRSLKVRRKSATADAPPYSLRFTIGEAQNHKP